MAFDFYPFPADYHAQCNTMWALTDFTIENGGTHVVPGSSAVDDEAAFALPGGQVEMRRGSVLFYDGKVLHGGGANRSTGPRQGVNITYCVGWVRQEENQYLACPPEIARTLDDDLLRVMGYQEGAFALGYVGAQEDPLAVLRGEQRKKKTIGEHDRSPPTTPSSSTSSATRHARHDHSPAARRRRTHSGDRRRRPDQRPATSVRSRST